MDNMRKKLLFLFIGLCIAGVFIAGCTTPTTTPPATTTQPAPVQTMAPVVKFGTPEPTQMLPVNYTLDFTVQSNGNTANPITGVQLRGGNGMNLDSRVDVNLTTPDGMSQQKSMLPPFYTGQNVTFPSSSYQNRVEIWVTAPTVGTVKTYDAIVPFTSINP